MNKVPQIVVDFVEKLGNKKTPRFQRDIACQHLENIIDVAQKAINTYKNENEKRSRVS